MKKMLIQLEKKINKLKDTMSSFGQVWLPKEDVLMLIRKAYEKESKGKKILGKSKSKHKGYSIR